MKNRRIKNATPIDGYRSNLERTCAKLLLEAGLNFQYEKKKFTVIDKFYPAITSYHHTKRGFKKQSKKDGSPNIVQSITYTPDFYYEDKNTIIIIETKGYMNDRYPNVKKLFFKFLTEQQSKIKNQKSIYFLEPSNTKEIKESINIIKTILEHGT